MLIKHVAGPVYSANGYVISNVNILITIFLLCTFLRRPSIGIQLVGPTHFPYYNHNLSLVKF